MSFRRQRDEWDEFLTQHREELHECGIPEKIISSELRFLMFLEHGFDEWEWKTNPHGLFHPKYLTDEQIARLAKLVGTHVDPDYEVLVASRWQRSR